MSDSISLVFTEGNIRVHAAETDMRAIILTRSGGVKKFVVPNHLTLQWANEFLHLYPSAKLLVATKKDFETANRKKFCARIATGDYDAVIIGHSQFEKIPLSAERQERQLREQINEIEGAIAELKWQRGENFTIKQMEKTRKSLEGSVIWSVWKTDCLSSLRNLMERDRKELCTPRSVPSVTIFAKPLMRY